MQDKLSQPYEFEDIKKQLDMLRRDGYLEAECIIRDLVRRAGILDMCENEEGTLPLVKDLREYAKLYKSGETLNRKIVKTEVVMEMAADVIEHLWKKNSAKKLELEYLKTFAHEAYFDTEICRDQLRSLWTAYCLHNDLMVDTATYDSDILELWSVVSLGEKNTTEWSSFDSFDDFMCAHLV